MSKDKHETTEGRRGFLKLAGFGAVAGGAAVVASAAPAKAESNESKPAGGGYRLTEHVKKTYELARF